MKHRGIVLLDRGTGREVMKRYCRNAGISIRTVEDLVDEELRQQGKARRHGIFEAFDRILDEALAERDGDSN